MYVYRIDGGVSGRLQISLTLFYFVVSLHSVCNHSLGWLSSGKYRVLLESHDYCETGPASDRRRRPPCLPRRRRNTRDGRSPSSSVVFRNENELGVFGQ